MRSDPTELPLPSPPSPTNGWMPFGVTAAMQGWPGVLGSAVGAFPEPRAHPAPAASAPVVSLAERRESDAQRLPPRRVPAEDIVTLDRTTAEAPPQPAPDDDILDLAHVASRNDSPSTDRFAPIPFRRSPEPSGERMRRIVYLTAAGIIMATGAVYTYKTSNAPRVISVPDAISPTNRVT